MDASTIAQISTVDLGIALLLMGAVTLLAHKLELGVSRRILVSTVRAFIQLLALGLVLRWVFVNQSWWLITLIIVSMLVAGTQIALSRTQSTMKGLWFEVFVTLTLSMVIVVVLVVQVIVAPDPWYDARIMLSLVGMILGNGVAAVAVALDRLLSDMDSRTDEIFAMVALGATPREAAMPSIRQSVSAGLIPTISTMSAAGIVTIPGMMAGQIIAGADPVTAATYQILVLVMISAVTILADILIILFTYRKRFADDGYFLSPAFREEPRHSEG